MKYSYELHVMENKLLPFIFHLDDVNRTTEWWTPNWHTNIEILMCIEGECSVMCGTREYKFCEGDILVVNPNVVHRIFTSTHARYYCLIVDEDFCRANAIDLSRYTITTLICDAKLRQIYTRLVSAYDADDELKIPAIRCFVLELMLALVRNHSQPADGNLCINNTINAERARTVVEYIQSNLKETITLDDISSHVGLSKYHLSRDFKKFTGSTIFEFINLVRCKTASALIAGGMSVSAAANECGFENLSYFSRTFKKYMGKLPSEKR